MREIVPSHGAAVRNKRATQWWGEFSANPTGLPPHCCCLASSAFLQSRAPRLLGPSTAGLQGRPQGLAPSHLKLGDQGMRASGKPSIPCRCSPAASPAGAHFPWDTQGPQAWAPQQRRQWPGWGSQEESPRGSRQFAHQNAYQSKTGNDSEQSGKVLAILTSLSYSNAYRN